MSIEDFDRWADDGGPVHDRTDHAEEREDSIQIAFERFHQTNPRVYEWLVDRARQARARGYQQLGIELLFAVLRWETMMETSDPSQDTYRLNNNYRSRYARLIMEREPDLAEFFITRELRHGSE